MPPDSSPADPVASAPGPIIGPRPWFPWPLSRWRWWNASVRAERLAALRIGLALVLLVDILSSYLPLAGDYLSRDSIGDRSQYNYRFEKTSDKEKTPTGRWSLLRTIDDPNSVRLVMAAWAGATFLLLIGLFSRLSAAVVWALSVSVANINNDIDNAGDTVRILTLFYLMLGPSGAAWSVDAWFRRRYRWRLGGRDVTPGLYRRNAPLTAPFSIHPWPLRLLFIQLMLIYLCNGLYKAGGNTWHAGSSLYYVLGDLTLSRFSYAMLPIPYRLTQLLTWMVLWWEVLIAPLMLVPWRSLADRVERVQWLGIHHLHVLLRWNREILLAFGASFHLGILFGMEIGGFPLYVLCLYLPLLPWERWRWRPAPAKTPQA